MKFAIVGARLAGSYVSLLLARMGHDVLLFDHTTASEKPCGGGVTAKAFLRMPWFRERSLPHTQIRTVRMATLDGRTADLALRQPIQIYSRTVLDTALREAAGRAGACFIPERASRFARYNGGWIVSTSSGDHEVDFLVGADGAASGVRSSVHGKYLAGDLSLALGYYLPGIYHQHTVIAQFQESGFEGYLWSFPRLDHSSVGILRWLPHAHAASMQRRVRAFIQSRYPGPAAEEMRFYAARIPCLSQSTLIGQRVCGDNWALLGDAAGFADAITAEGISFALRSAELLADAIRMNEPLTYEELWRKDFGAELQRASAWKDRFYGGQFLFRTFTARSVQATHYSPTVQKLTDRFISGASGYEALRRRLILMSPRILIEAAVRIASGSRLVKKPAD